MIERLVSAIRGEGPPGLVWTDARDTRSSEAGDTASEEVDPADEELFLEPDERVLVLLSEHDGRMLQQDVVEGTGYSPARVSELLGELEDEGRVNRYWKEGQKVVTFPELGPP